MIKCMCLADNCYVLHQVVSTYMGSWCEHVENKTKKIKIEIDIAFKRIKRKISLVDGRNCPKWGTAATSFKEQYDPPPLPFRQPLPCPFPTRKHDPNRNHTCY